jgi:nucleotide sugar dehydrogenase
MRVAILGVGIIGSAQARLFAGHDLVTYDPRMNAEYPAQEIASCDFAVICVGTPEGPDGQADLDDFREAVSRLPLELPVLIRSTVPPGTTEKIAESRPGHVAFCPEYMHERDGGAWKESWQVPWLILGGTPEATSWFRGKLFRVHPGHIYCCTATVAELSKYTANLYWATRITFVNEMAAVAASFGADWEDVREAWLQDARIDPAYTGMEGFPPGFGGRCLPKDLAAIIAESEYKAQFLQAIQDANHRFTA